MSLVAIPTSASSGRKWVMYAGFGLVGVACLGLVWWMMHGFSSGPGPSAGQFYTVAVMDLDVKIIKDGELGAMTNVEIVSEVEGIAAIQTIVKEGSNVKKGDVLVVLDSSTIKQRIEDTTLELQKAAADLTTSKEMKEIQESQNSANLEAADVGLTLARLDLQAYTEGIYPQDLQNAQTTLEMSKINLKSQQEDLSQTKSLFGKGFMTATDVKKGELAVTTATNDVAKAQSALKVLTEYTHPKDLADKKNTVSQAEQKLVRTQRENAANLNQRNADVQAKTQSFNVLTRRMEHWKDQLEACTISAPMDGMVIYASSNDRWSDVRIQEGATVRERQTLLRLPDTSSMKATVRINEAVVGKLSEGLRARVKISNVPRPIGATLSKISVLADSGGRFFNPDLKEYPVDLVLDETPRSLKPGMSSQVEILVNHQSNVLAVPLSTIYSAGADAYVFTRDGEKVKPAKVRIGQSNDTHVQIREGIEAGAQVLLLQPGQGKELLEQNGIKIEPTTQSSDGFGPRRQRNRDGGGGGGNGGGPRPEGIRPEGAPVVPGPGGVMPPNGNGPANPSGAIGPATPGLPNGITTPGLGATGQPGESPDGGRRSRRRDGAGPTSGPSGFAP